MNVDVEARGVLARVERPVASLEAARRRRLRLTVPAAAGMLAAAAAVLLYVATHHRPGTPREDDVISKGSPVILVVHVAEGQGSRRLADGDQVSAGDRLRFEVRAPAAGQVAVVGVDSRGVTTVYYPYGATAGAPFDPAAPLLPGAIELDDSPGEERFIALWVESGIDLRPILAGLASGAPLPAGVAASSVTLRKK